ncbi:MAG: exodeoxyribonuclease VII small subunit [Desulfobacteraceae bacterium 4572_130]|nr:MAG: exodeoxyribonuclease VII small subunit [Desulfobacteraceae bacterium 4572_130]
MSKKNFKELISQLEEIVKELESGELSLENALKKFEKGIKYASLCNEKLDEAEKKVSLLIKDNKGNFKEKVFNNE